jgi:hypothetical protein
MYPKVIVSAARSPILRTSSSSTAETLRTERSVCVFVCVCVEVCMCVYVSICNTRHVFVYFIHAAFCTAYTVMYNVYITYAVYLEMMKYIFCACECFRYLYLCVCLCDVCLCVRVFDVYFCACVYVCVSLGESARCFY